MNWQEIGWVLERILLAAAVGGAIGFERESHGQAAGFRTNILVSIGACLMMMLSLDMEVLYRHLDSYAVVRLDPGRIASYAIASMGFLGAGAIIKGKGSVRGLTTAATLWLVTGLGLSVGAGFIGPAVLTTVVCLLILYNLRHLKTYYSHDIYTILSLTFEGLERPFADVKEILRLYPGIKIQFVNYQQEVNERRVTYRIRLLSKDREPWGQVVNRLLQLPGLAELAWEEGDVP
ncbi:MAG TPA: methyltransferase [Syntrophobacteraceae bacterium]|nr:methyltransferase [Syntrophobacteraceae bacterium]HBD07941.1 methyltransferase [Syntrophobacteraceae bacterium]HBZ54194.1 methyltransferase [Syntrophobacteraceae bacterium]